MATKLKNQIIIGKAKVKSVSMVDGKKVTHLFPPKRKFILRVQERISETKSYESMGSIMVYDYTGNATQDKIFKAVRKQLQKHKIPTKLGK